MKGIFGLFTYFSQLDRDGSGYLEKDEIECKYPLTSGLLRSYFRFSPGLLPIRHLI